MNDNQDPQDERDPDMPQQSQHPRHKSRGHKHSVNPLAHSHSRGTGKKFKVKAKVANKGIKHAVVSFAVANAGWIAMILGVLFVILIVIMMAFTLTDDDDDCQSGGGSDAGLEVSGKDNPAKVYNFLVSKEHFTSAGAAGAVGRAMNESGQSVSPTIVNPTSGATGIFQWGTGGSIPARLNHGGFVKIGDKSTYTLANELKLTDYELHHGYNGVLAKMKHESDPGTAAEDWTAEYEGASGQGDGPTHTYALRVYSKFAHGGAGPADVSDTADSGDSSASSCGGSDGGDTADGTGSISEKPNSEGVMNWPFHHIPSDMQKYIPDPQKLGMHWSSSAGWYNPGNQCVHFASSYFHLIWHTSQKPMVATGGEEADEWASIMHGSASGTPHAGAIASCHGAPLATPGPGHTFIVVHVLGNGDILCLEQNMVDWGHNGAGSGDDKGQSCTWDVLLVSKQCYTSNHFKFFTPKGKPTWK